MKINGVGIFPPVTAKLLYNVFSLHMKVRIDQVDIVIFVSDYS